MVRKVINQIMILLLMFRFEEERVELKNLSQLKIELKTLCELNICDNQLQYEHRHTNHWWPLRLFEKGANDSNFNAL